MNFKQYLAESEKKYVYRLKTVLMMDKNAWKTVELFLKRYHLLNFGKPTKTILQKRPLDFTNLENREVHMVEVTLGLPASPDTIQRELCVLLNSPLEYFVVRGENDPIEIQSARVDQANDIAAQADEKNVEQAALLSTESEYPEADRGVEGSNYYGNEYNSRLLKYMKEVSDERVEKMKVDAPNPLFSWLDMPKSDAPTDGFNPEPEKTPKADKGAKKPTRFGNFDDEDTTIKKTYVDGKGREKTLTAKPKSVRKD